MSRSVFTALLLLLGACLAALTYYATRAGVGLSPDADTYIALAKQLAAGEDLHATSTSPSARTSNAPTTHYPPLYPLVLAGISKLGVEITTGARWLNMLAFAGVVVLAGVILCAGLGLERGAALLGAAIVAVARHLLYINAMVLSDGVFLVLLLSAWLLVGWYLDSRRIVLLIAGGVVIAMAMMTRYAAVGLAGGAGLALLVYPGRPLRRRVADAALLGAISGLPIAVWLARNVQQHGSAVDRGVALHLPPGPQWERAAETVAQWLWPTPEDWMVTAGVVVVAVLCGVAGLSFRNARREGRTSLSGVACVMLMFIACYVPVVLGTVTFVDANVWMDFRILAPLQLAMTMLVFAELARSRLPASAGAISRAWPAIMGVGVGLFIVAQSARAFVFAHDAPELYVGYSMVKWRDSETLSYLNDLPADTLLYTNATALLRLRTGRLVKQVPAVIDSSSLKPLPGLEQRLRVMERELRNKNGYVVYFDDVRRPALISLEQLKRELKLRTIHRARDGEILQLRASKRE